MARMIRTIKSDHNGIDPIAFAGVILLARDGDIEVGEFTTISWSSFRLTGIKNNIGEITFKSIKSNLPDGTLNKDTIRIYSYAENEHCAQAKIETSGVIFDSFGTVKLKDIILGKTYMFKFDRYPKWEYIIGSP